MDGHSGNRPAGCGDDRQLRSVRDVASRVDILDRSVIVLVDDQSTELVSLASQLRSQVVRRILTDGEVETLTVERHAILKLDPADLAIFRDDAPDRPVEHGHV